jgi:hypothetical protein
VSNMDGPLLTLGCVGRHWHDRWHRSGDLTALHLQLGMPLPHALRGAFGRELVVRLAHRCILRSRHPPQAPQGLRS